jgi:hypothetical protein
MKFLREIAQIQDNAIFASIHPDGDLGSPVLSNDPYSENLAESVSIDQEQRLRSHYKFSDIHIDSIKDYTRNSKKQNNYHWERHKKTSDRDELYEARASKLDKVLKRHRAPEDITVHTGIGYDPRNKRNAKGIVHHPAYLSTSLDKKAAVKFSEKATSSVYQKTPTSGEIHFHTLSVNVPKGHPGAYVDHHSSVPGEKEFILPRNTKMKMVEHHQKKEGFITHKGVKYTRFYHTHKMEIVK